MFPVSSSPSAICFSLLLLILNACTGWCAQYEVGPAAPYKNLQSVSRLLKPGDTVTVAGGVTYPGGVTLDANGTEGAGVISIIGKRVNGSRPILSGVTAPGGTVLRIRGSHYIIDGFDLTAGGDPRASRCFYNVGDDVTLRNSVVHDCHFTGIAGADASGSLTLDHVEVYHCGVGLYAHQIYVGSSLEKYPRAVFRMRFCYVHDGTGGNNVKSRVTQNEIEYNWMEGAGYHELDLVGPDPKSQKIPRDCHCDADIIGNVLISTPSSLGTIARFGSDGTGSSDGRYRLVNNTIIAKGPLAAGFGLLWLKGQIASLLITNNVFWAAEQPAKFMRSDTNSPYILEGSGNWIPSATTSVPESLGVVRGSVPGFTDPTADNLTPTTGSPLIDAGQPPPPALQLSAIPPTPTNFDSPARPRPTGREKDIGAYPFMPPAGKAGK